jgi:hypothetical protein
MPFHGFDSRIQRTKVEALHEIPDQPGAVIRRQQPLQVHRPQLHLDSVRPLHPRGLAALVRLWDRRQREQGVVHEPNRTPRPCQIRAAPLPLNPEPAA